MADRPLATRSVPDVVIPSRLPLDLDRRVGAIERRVTDTSGGTEMRAVDAPDAATRTMLVDRRAMLRASLAPSDELWVAQHVAALLGVRPGSSDDEGDRERVQRIYIHTLAKKPRFALEKAFDDAHNGRIGLPHLPPTPAEIVQAADRHATWVHAELRQLGRILDAKVIHIPTDPELRRKAVATIDETVEAIRAAGEAAEAARAGTKWNPPPPRIRETPQEALARLQGQPLPKFSPVLRRALSLPECQPQDDERRVAR